MACPYFQPLQVASPPTHPNARLPLIEEYEGLCHAVPNSLLAPASDHLFRFCNHGNARGACPHFPTGDLPTSFRYQVAACNETQLEILMMEEKNYWPHSWRRVHFQIAAETLEPEVSAPVVRAQLLAFCRSYLKRFGANERGNEN